MEINKVQQMEFDIAEEALLNALFGQSAIPQYASLMLKQFNINPNTYLRKIENYIAPFMGENGLVEGKSLNRILKAFAPNVAQFLQLPDEDFRLVDITENAMSLLQKVFPAIAI